LKLAKTKLKAAGIEVQLDRGLASALPYAGESFDRALSSLFFQHLPSESKLEAREALPVLGPGGEFHIADWGKPAGPAMRLAFVAVQVLDGFATTTDNVRGLLPDLLGLAGGEKVETTNSYSTLLGTVPLYEACKRHMPRKKGGAVHGFLRLPLLLVAIATAVFAAGPDEAASTASFNNPSRRWSAAISPQSRRWFRPMWWFWRTDIATWDGWTSATIT